MRCALTQIRVTDNRPDKTQRKTWLLVASSRQDFTGSSGTAKQKARDRRAALTCMMLLRRGWRLLRYSFFTSISLRIFSLLDKHSRYFSASLLRKDRALVLDALQGYPDVHVYCQNPPSNSSRDELMFTKHLLCAWHFENSL